LGEYAAVIEWLVEKGRGVAWSGFGGLASEVSEEMRPALWDAMDRAAMRRVARFMDRWGERDDDRPGPQGWSADLRGDGRD
jgi:hypothetical protein